MAILITGGAGYIGSSIANTLIDNAQRVVVIDDLSVGRREFIPRADLYVGDIGDRTFVADTLRRNPDIGAVIHCAAKIVVPDSVREPLLYYDNNVAKTVTLLGVLSEARIGRFIFSSTAALYDVHDGGAASESAAVRPLSPYSRSKRMVEQMLTDYCAISGMRCLILRYFNPIGADPELRSGHPASHPTHVLGRLVSATLRHESFYLTGVNWDTRDGTGVRDYVDVWDLADAHAKAFERFDSIMASRGQAVLVVNLGTGRGVTVRELVQAYQAAAGAQLEVIEAPPREGDVAGAFATNDLARSVLGWVPKRSLEESIRAALAWAKRRPSILKEG